MLGLTKIVRVSVTGVHPLKDVLYVVSTRKKHYNPKYKWHRQQKYLPVELPNFEEKYTKEKQRTKMKELGIGPPRYWRTRPITITSLTDILDPYVPPEADGKASLLNKSALKNVMSKAKSKKEDMKATRKIRSYDINFDVKTFSQEAHDIYIKAHTVLMNKDPEELSNYVTERANVEMMEGLKLRSLRWKFIESLEPPLVVQSRVGEVVSASNVFAQITVRFHTRQTLAIYDRFGRLFYGSEIVPKDVLEYVVFEKHIVNIYGIWRMHAKIIPDWMPPKEPSPRTYRIETLDEEDEEEDIIEEDYEIPDDSSVQSTKSKSESVPSSTSA